MTDLDVPMFLEYPGGVSGMVVDKLLSLEIPVSHCLGWVTEMTQF